MLNKFLFKNIIKLIFIIAVFTVILVGLLGFTYIKIIPHLIKNQKVINYIESISSKTLGAQVQLDSPYIITSYRPELKFGVGKLEIRKDKVTLLDVKDFNTNITLHIISDKMIKLNDISFKDLYIDANKLLDLPILKKKNDNQPSEWKIDFFQANVELQKLKIDYKPNKITDIQFNANDVSLLGNKDFKTLKYNIDTKILKDKKSIEILTNDSNSVNITNFSQINIKNTPIIIKQENNISKLFVTGYIDKSYKYNISVNSKRFSIQSVLDLLDSQIIKNDISKQLVYFKKIKGSLNFKIAINDGRINGFVKTNNTSFLFNPLYNLPIFINNGSINFTEKNIVINNISGYYNNKKNNTINFTGKVSDYLNNMKMNIVGDALITNDFARNYLSKILNYPITIKGEANTRIMVKSKGNKFDLTWLYLFKKGSGFIIDNVESEINDITSRVLKAEMHFENTLLTIKSIDYYNGERNTKQSKESILRFMGNIDLANNNVKIKDFGLEIPQPLHSEFINILLGKRLLIGGTLTGKIKYLANKNIPSLTGKLEANEVKIPSQRLFMKHGEFDANKDLLKIKSNGRYRRSEYNLYASITNKLIYPIIVKDLNLDMDKINVEKYLKLFNTPVSTETQTNVADLNETSDEETTPTFDFANLIIEQCKLHIAQGHYKDINFSDLEGDLTLDKNSLLKIHSNRFAIAEGYTSAKIECDLKKHLYDIKLGIKDVDSDIIAANLLNLQKEINGKASGLIHLTTDDSLKLNGNIRFKIENGIIEKIGVVEYVMKAASLFRNPITMISPSAISDLIHIPEGKFDKINGELTLKDNVIVPMKIKSTSSQLASYIIGTYNLENGDAALRIYTKFSDKKKGIFGFLRGFSLNSLANKISIYNNTNYDYYSSEIESIPDIEADDKDVQIFLTKVDGDIEHYNFISTLKKLK